MLVKLLLLLTIMPLVELTLVLWLHEYSSWQFTLLFVIGTGVLGAVLMRHQGRASIRRVREDLAAGRLPTDSLLDGLLIFVAGILLLTPGVLTDLAGILLMVPPVRTFARARVAAWMRSRFSISAAGMWPGGDGSRSGTSATEVLEAQVTRTYNEPRADRSAQ